MPFKLTFFLLAATLLTGTKTFAAPLPLLHAQGTTLADPSGHVVTLKGINLGGWLVEEMWMQPFVTTPPAGSAFQPIKDHVSLWNTVETRFGPAGKARVQTAFRSAWLNEGDFKRLHDAGFNCVRLPFLASIVSEPGGLHWLDQAVQWGADNGIYVILDMHGAPGSQSDQGHTGQADLTMFFKDPANVTRAEKVWTQIARRYKGNPAVAGYDTINEPTATPNSDTLYVIQDRLYRAIRAADPGHLVIIEDGYTGIQWMPVPGAERVGNVAYSSHYYNFNAKSDADQQKSVGDYVQSVEKESARRTVPFYIGEYGLEPHGSKETLTSLLQTLDTQHISSSLWTYKVMWTGGGQSLWSLYSNPKPVTPLNPFTDTEDQLIQKCAQLRTDRLDSNPNVAAAFAPPTNQTAQTQKEGTHETHQSRLHAHRAARRHRNHRDPSRHSIPVFQKVRENARRTQCISNQKQIGLAVMQYTQDYDEYYPASIDINYIQWYNAIQPYIKNGDLYQGQSYGAGGVFHCPDFPNPAQGQQYGCSDGLFVSDFGLTAATARKPWSLAVIDAPADKIMIAEKGLNGDTWGYETFLSLQGWWATSVLTNGQYDPNKDNSAIGVTPTMDRDNSPPANTPWEGGRTVRYRHNGTTDVLFCDGHVKSMTKGSIKWYKNVYIPQVYEKNAADQYSWAPNGPT